jgi:hypothetical protein
VANALTTLAQVIPDTASTAALREQLSRVAEVYDRAARTQGWANRWWGPALRTCCGLRPGNPACPEVRPWDDPASSVGCAGTRKQPT